MFGILDGSRKAGRNSKKTYKAVKAGNAADAKARAKVDHDARVDQHIKSISSDQVIARIDAMNARNAKRSAR